MIDNKMIIPITVYDKSINLTIVGESNSHEKTIVEKSDAIVNGEAPVQLKEGCFYEYKIDEGYSLQASEIVTQSKVNKSSGRICPNIYVGTLSINIIENATNKECAKIKLEVQSVKASYRQDYRYMLEEITDKCTDLLLQSNSPVTQNLEVNPEADAKTMYQRFAFLKSIIDTEEFNNSIQKILSSPVTRWKEIETIKDIRSVRRINNNLLRQIGSANNRVDYPLTTAVKSIPSKLRVSHKTETVDTPENRFVKHALFSFQSFLNDIRTKAKSDKRLELESLLLEDKLEQYLSHSIFKELSPLTTLPLNSPVLQRKEGYRGVLRNWLMFDLAAKLVWHGGDDVYSGNKRDVAVLYEYWLFFKLLDIVKEVFKIEPKSVEELIKPTSDGLGLQLKQGQLLKVAGEYKAATRRLSVELCYNKTFNGNNNYPNGGSWTRSMRPDYTLSIWPYGISAQEAEKEELIVHVHFDAKYKVENLSEILGNEVDLITEKEEQNKGTYKRADLLKMHTYKDAIRRTAGAYILYPGTDKAYAKIGFHEIIPGLGAFSIRPSKTNSGTEELTKFLNEVVQHFLNRASQREKISLRVYETYKDDSINEVNEDLPEPMLENRTLLPDDTYVLVGYYKKQNLDWILKNQLYNARAESKRGSLRLGPGESAAKYLLLHTEGELITSKLFKITETGPRIFSKKNLMDRKYPSEPSQDFYLVYRIGEVQEKVFLNRKWDISKLEMYKPGRGSVLPFSITMTELMAIVVK
ncbi:MAG: DUF2357 domain-containing protein [Ginsengibacter sp.]